MTPLALSTGLHCGVYGGVGRCLMCNAERNSLNSLLVNWCQLSVTMTSGHPFRKQIWVLTASVTAFPVAFFNGRNSIHLVKWSCITSSQLCPAEDLGNGPIESVEIICHG